MIALRHEGLHCARPWKAWAPRLAQRPQALYARALGGLTGPKGTQMPPRGGNSRLTDDEVKAAVDYMTVIVK